MNRYNVSFRSINWASYTYNNKLVSTDYINVTLENVRAFTPQEAATMAIEAIKQLFPAASFSLQALVRTPN